MDWFLGNVTRNPSWARLLVWPTSEGRTLSTLFSVYKLSKNFVCNTRAKVLIFIGKLEIKILWFFIKQRAIVVIGNKTYNVRTQFPNEWVCKLSLADFAKLLNGEAFGKKIYLPNHQHNILARLSLKNNLSLPCSFIAHFNAIRFEHVN